MGTERTRCLVTGAAGFIGSRLAARLSADGHGVVGLDDLSAGSMENLRSCPEVDFVECDLRDEGGVRAAARGCRVIFHQGAVRSVPRSIEAPILTTEVNVGGTLNVLAAAREESAKVVFASSSSVYGDQDSYPLHERLPPRPRSPYAASKLAGEAFCHAWSRSFGIPTVSLRYFNVYGPGQDPSSEYAMVVPVFILACITGERPTIHGDGEQARDFTYIDDVLEANSLAMRAPDESWGGVFNIGGGRSPTSVNELLAMVADLTEADPEPVHAAPRPGDVRRTHADISLAGRVLGYTPRTELRTGLRHTVEWFRARRPTDALGRT
jgi:UDP-N-acetylglucosamine/UDP-N-acetyl-alpha-D-glucosaminouronate 4-epimerase